MSSLDAPYPATIFHLVLTDDEAYRTGDGAVSGLVATDNVRIAPGLPIVRGSFGVITAVTGLLASSPAAGVLGLGFGALARIPGLTTFEQLVATGTLAKNLFAIYYTRGQVTGSELSVGAVDPAHFSATGVFS